MSRLNPHECRVLGVLIEKAQTTPAQYPLTLNALVNGANQRSNRNPVLELTEEQAIAALDGLRLKGLVREVMLSGSRVQKHRHVARETMGVSTAELVVLAELLLRGPQTVGELRSRASRMHPLESLEAVTNVLEHLADRPKPYVRRLPPDPGSRVERYAQLLCPELHAVETTPQPTRTTSADTDPSLAKRVASLEKETGDLREAVRKLAVAMGEADPFPSGSDAESA